ncbi:hypothetical protein A2U01_0105564, partial [Trifolium medium]|nr:hypothetical protein [Trifolium medium]
HHGSSIDSKQHYQVDISPPPPDSNYLVGRTTVSSFQPSDSVELASLNPTNVGNDWNFVDVTDDVVVDDDVDA